MSPRPRRAVASMTGQSWVRWASAAGYWTAQGQLRPSKPAVRPISAGHGSFGTLLREASPTIAVATWKSRTATVFSVASRLGNWTTSQPPHTSQFPQIAQPVPVPRRPSPDPLRPSFRAGSGCIESTLAPPPSIKSHICTMYVHTTCIAADISMLT